jgi:hypothetical protein
MKATKIFKSVLLAAVTVGMVSGCDVYVHQPAAEVEVAGPPPPAPAEVDVETPMPGPDYIWIGGAWDWGPGNRWVWDRGHWGRRPYAGASWRASHYEYRNGHHVYVHGGWR